MLPFQVDPHDDELQSFFLKRGCKGIDEVVQPELMVDMVVREFLE